MDNNNDDTFLQDSIAKEMKNVNIEFYILVELDNVLK